MYRVEIIIKGTADEMALAVRIAKATLHRDGVCHIEIDVSKERIIFDRLPAEIRSSGKWHRQQSARPVYLREIRDDAISRSEEHTSELQSLMRISYADFCLQKQNV